MLCKVCKADVPCVLENAGKGTRVAPFTPEDATEEQKKHLIDLKCKRYCGGDIPCKVDLIPKCTADPECEYDEGGGKRCQRKGIHAKRDCERRENAEMCNRKDPPCGWIDEVKKCKKFSPEERATRKLRDKDNKFCEAICDNGPCKNSVLVGRCIGTGVGCLCIGTVHWGGALGRECSA